MVLKGDCFGKNPRNDTDHAFDGTLHVVIASTFDLLSVNSAKQSFTHKKTVPPEKGVMKKLAKKEVFTQ